MSKSLKRMKNWAGGPGEVLRNFSGKKVPGGSLTNGRVGGLKSARRKGK
jgi:hypothetical protein